MLLTRYWFLLCTQYVVLSETEQMEPGYSSRDVFFCRKLKIPMCSQSVLATRCRMMTFASIKSFPPYFLLSIVYIFMTKNEPSNGIILFSRQNRNKTILLRSSQAQSLSKPKKTMVLSSPCQFRVRKILVGYDH